MLPRRDPFQAQRKKDNAGLEVQMYSEETTAQKFKKGVKVAKTAICIAGGVLGGAFLLGSVNE